MDRGRKALPIGNRAVAKRLEENRRNQHLKSLANMKASIDCAKPKTMVARKSNGKKEALLEMRYAEIERENRMLLEKMSNIMRKGGSGVDATNDSIKGCWEGVVGML